MFQVFRLQTRSSGTRAIRNRLLRSHGLYVERIVSIDELTRTNLIAGKDSPFQVLFPVNCLIQVFVGEDEPEPYAQYLAEVKKIR